eukprot:scaffold125999_cov25-Tisochrysis_lutea.AAC.3
MLMQTLVYMQPYSNQHMYMGKHSMCACVKPTHLQPHMSNEMQTEAHAGPDCKVHALVPTRVN